MTEREMIEEMTKDFKLCCPCDWFDGYIDDEGQLATSSNRYCNYIFDKDSTKCSACREVAKVLIGAGYRKVDEVRKETARDIIADIKSCMQDFEDDDDGYLLKKCEFEFFMREIAKEYGVEVEE